MPTYPQSPRTEGAELVPSSAPADFGVIPTAVAIAAVDIALGTARYSSIMSAEKSPQNAFGDIYFLNR